MDKEGIEDMKIRHSTRCHRAAEASYAEIERDAYLKKKNATKRKLSKEEFICLITQKKESGK